MMAAHDADRVLGTADADGVRLPGRDGRGVRLSRLAAGWGVSERDEATWRAFQSDPGSLLPLDRRTDGRRR